MKASSISSEIGLAAQVPTLAKRADRDFGSPVIRKAAPALRKESPQLTEINPELVKHALEGIQAVVNGLGLSLEFSSDTETGQRIITVYDLETGEVIRQIPPNEVLSFLRQIQGNKGLSTGLFFSRRL